MSLDKNLRDVTIRYAEEGEIFRLRKKNYKTHPDHVLLNE